MGEKISAFCTAGVSHFVFDIRILFNERDFINFTVNGFCTYEFSQKSKSDYEEIIFTSDFLIGKQSFNLCRDMKNKSELRSFFRSLINAKYLRGIKGIAT